MNLWKLGLALRKGKERVKMNNCLEFHFLRIYIVNQRVF